ncbi:hypothetical protein Dsin_032292 [Dipteronia sinensis]|uniref:Uncharacterized protein n=1 Tax=Dipteronia sinensis TaxID=43782 RepID=A0AAD9ZMY2_9ROSI|nr:hypothetical protein Dsin_032292 [Dipteronia sinensis]
MTKGINTDELNEPVGNSNFGATIALQNNDQMPHLNQGMMIMKLSILMKFGILMKLICY